VTLEPDVNQPNTPRGLPTPPREDLDLSRRFEKSLAAGGRLSDQDVLRLTWIWIRRGDQPNANDEAWRRLAARFDLPALVTLVRGADLASSTPAGTSGEFVWRNPHLVEELCLDAGVPDSGRVGKRRESWFRTWLAGRK